MSTTEPVAEIDWTIYEKTIKNLKIVGSSYASDLMADLLSIVKELKKQLDSVQQETNNKPQLNQAASSEKIVREERGRTNDIVVRTLSNWIEDTEVVAKITHDIMTQINRDNTKKKTLKWNFANEAYE